MFERAGAVTDIAGAGVDLEVLRRAAEPGDGLSVVVSADEQSREEADSNRLGDITYGEVFTKRWVVELILDLIGYTADRDLAACVALEPACGTGAFLAPMVQRLCESLRLHGRLPEDALDALRAHDLLTVNVDAARHAVGQCLVDAGWASELALLTARTWITQEDFLLYEQDAHSADFVVGNPPYIRLEDIPQERSDAYRAACKTMGGRADIFVGFYEIGLRALRSGGKLGFICADRWMHNGYGKHLRELVTEQFAVDATIAMHDVDAFDRPVSAYPAITVLRAGKQGPALMADTTRDFNAAAAKDLAQWATDPAAEAVHRTGVAAARVPHWFETGAGWPAGNPDRLALVAQLEERFPLLEETGAKVGIGLASGADDIFVVQDSEVAEPERMLPMVMREDLKTGRVEWSGHYLVNPWSQDGLVDLDEWPNLRAYFRPHWKQLCRRNTAQKNPGREHRTIDRVIEGLAARPKLLLADMGAHIWPVLEEGHYYPHHNLYWIHENGGDWDLEVLGGFLLSEVAQLFISTYCVKMRGGTLRFQAQYLRRIRAPHFSTIGEVDRRELREAFKRRDTEAATRVAARLCGIAHFPGVTLDR